MIYVVWKNYDETKVDRHRTIEDAEKKVSWILGEIGRDPFYGTELLAVISGKEMAVNKIKVATRVKLMEGGVYNENN